MTDFIHYPSSDSPSRCLASILGLGGKITRADDRISVMLNGLRCYSLEAAIVEYRFHIQAYEEQALELYNIAMSVLNDKKDIENNKVISK